MRGATAIAIVISLLTAGCAALPDPWIPAPSSAQPWRGKLEGLAVSANGKIVALAWNGPDASGVVLLSSETGRVVRDAVIRPHQIAFVAPANDGERALVETRCRVWPSAAPPCSSNDVGVAELNFVTGALVPVQLPFLYQQGATHFTWRPAVARFAYGEGQGSVVSLHTPNARSQSGPVGPTAIVEVRPIGSDGMPRELGRIGDTIFQLLLPPMATRTGAAAFGVPAGSNAAALIRIQNGHVQEARTIHAPRGTVISAVSADGMLALATAYPSVWETTAGHELLVLRNGAWSGIDERTVPFIEYPHTAVAASGDVAVFARMSSAREDGQPRLVIDRGGAAERIELPLAEQLGIGRTIVRPIMPGAELLRRLRAVARSGVDADPARRAATFGMRIGSSSHFPSQTIHTLVTADTPSWEMGNITEPMGAVGQRAPSGIMRLFVGAFSCISPDDEIVVFGQHGRRGIVNLHGHPQGVRSDVLNVHDIGGDWSATIVYLYQGCAFDLSIQRRLN